MPATNETYVPLSRGLLEHLPDIPDLAVKIYIYLLLTANFNGDNKGKINIPISDIATYLNIHRQTAWKCIKKNLIGKYLTMRPAKNQHKSTQFTILKYKTVQDFTKSALSPETDGTTDGTTDGRFTARLTAGLQQVYSNPREPLPEAGSQTPKKLRSKEVNKSQKKPPTPFSLPDWISQDAWNGYLEMRKKKNKSPTDYALKLIVEKLDKLRASGDTPEAVLNQSIENSWTGVHPVKGQTSNDKYHQRQLAQNRIGAHYPATEPQKEMTLEEYTAQMTELEREMTGNPTATWEPPEMLKNALKSRGDNVDRDRD